MHISPTEGPESYVERTVVGIADVREKTSEMFTNYFNRSLIFNNFIYNLTFIIIAFILSIFLPFLIIFFLS